ncbi:hypothetical protein [Chryseobacterium sp. Bi04]|uniref:hypothetical protein n=1 Tax=Chryseobacterium sp. Bi04 TaxID=2822345 RepID=UPI001D37B91E|nr:hypothetical protein [Chryseobacterium sp. Bi04]CAH0139234.1 hypothetical protein SRABI04_00495 [Chryseobacterium sp. Bi04]
MKSIVLKTQKIIFLVFGFSIVLAQNSMKVPNDAVFYMEVNGKQLNNKINWNKLNPLLHELSKKSKEKPSWTDYSKTGIKYDAIQYHYASFNDSIKTYHTHFIIDNKEKFQEFINSIKKKGQETSGKNNYSYVDIDDDIFVAWNGSRAVLSLISYTKPYKDLWADEAATVADSVAVAVDSVSVDSVYAEELEKPFDYKDEIKNLKEDIKYLRESIKDNNTEIARIQKDIKYLQKHHQYPKEKEEVLVPEPEGEGDYGSEYDDSESEKAYQKEQDSIRRENFKVVKKYAEDHFDQYFSSNLEVEASKEMLTFKDVNSDVFVYTDYGRIVNDGIYGKAMKRYDFGQVFQNMYNSNSAYNLYFDKDKVKLINNYQHKNAEMQKNISSIYKGKKNRKLLDLINEKSIGYYAVNINGGKVFDAIYSLIQDSGEAKYKKELELIMETMKIVLDEEAITKIAPGNGIFVLNELKSKKVDYTDYEYDDDYNEKEVKKTKDVAVPNFTFAFATENEGYWNRIFNVLTTNKKLAKNFSKVGNFYTFKDDKKEGYLDQLFFTVKDGVVYLTSSTDNITTAHSQSEVSRKWAKDSSRYPLSGRLDLQTLLIGLDKEFESPSERKTLDLFRKNVGELYYKTEVKEESIQTEMDYNIKNSSENSLMYFFDLFNEIFKIKDSEKKPPVL